MRFKQTLEIDSKEIDILNEALRMYRKRVDTCYEAGSFGERSKERFLSYRAKVTNMSRVMEAIKSYAHTKPVIDEQSVFEKIILGK